MANRTDVPDELNPDALEAKQHEGISNWVRQNLGGEVREIGRTERWRPQWKVVYAKDGTTDTVFVRGDRPIASKDGLRFEMEVMQALEANGIQVPHIYGWMDSPKAFVMEFIDTEDRAPGMLHTAIENPDVMTDDRWQAMLSYMDHLARMHEVPVSEFTHIQGLRHLETAEEIALNETERYYRSGVKTGVVDATLAYLQSWLRRNVPQHRTQESFIAGDAGQFMSQGAEVLALCDLEIACIGDTHWDLACFRGRHPYENMGDIPALYRRYAEASGKEVDLRVVGYHTVNFMQLSTIAAKWFMVPESTGANWIEGILEYASISRRALEAIAELHGIELDHDLHLSDAGIDALEESGLTKLVLDVDRLPTSSAFEPWERGLLGSIPRFLLNYARYRDWHNAATQADISRMTGRSYDDPGAADVAVREIIASGDPARDDELVRILHRRSLRLSMIIAGTDPNDANPLFHKLDPILG